METKNVKCLVFGNPNMNNPACKICENAFSDRFKKCFEKYYSQYNQDKLLKALLKLHIKMNNLLHKAVFNYRDSLSDKDSSKFFASTDSIVKHKLQDKELRQERIDFAVELFHKANKGLKLAEKQARKYCILARSYDYIFNDLLDNKTSRRFYDIIDFKDYLKD